MKIKAFECPKVLYMSFDKFLLAVESRDLSQADKSIKECLLSQRQVMDGRTSFHVFPQVRPEFCKMNGLNPLRFTSHQKY